MKKLTRFLLILLLTAVTHPLSTYAEPANDVDLRFQAVNQRLKELEDAVRARDVKIDKLESERKRVNT